MLHGLKAVNPYSIALHTDTGGPRSTKRKDDTADFQSLNSYYPNAKTKATLYSQP